MPVYKVYARAVLRQEFEVEAESGSEAYRKAEAQLVEGINWDLETEEVE